MDVIDLKNRARLCLSDNELPKLFGLLTSNLENSILRNDLILLKKRYSSLVQQKSSGLIPKDQYDTEENELSSSILKFVNGINHLNSTRVTDKSQEDYLFDVGLDEVVIDYQKKLKNIVDGERIHIIGGKNALKSYINSIKRTNWRFLTTSFLDSEFWYQPGDSFKVIHENQNMYGRILSTSDSKADLKRIFIIPDYFDSYILNQVDFAITQEKLYNDSSYLDRIEEISSNLLDLSSKIEMRIVEKHRLPKIYDKNFDPKNNKELALYDDIRIDAFSVDNRSINSVDIYTKKLHEFETIKDFYIRYFKLAWENSDSRNISEYIDAVREEIHFQKENKIDYETNWLLRYDYYVRSNNFVLVSEESRVVDFLHSYSRENNKKYNSYLDVGVCTGRYPVALSKEELVRDVSTIDSDYDVELFMNTYRSEFEFLRVDIRSEGVTNKLNSKYDLITCMLGTICHFGLKKQTKRYKNKSGLHRALENICKLIKSDGLLIISTWKKWSVLKDDIKLYNQKDINILRNNTPSTERISTTINNIDPSIKMIDHLGDKFFNILVYKKD